MWPWHFLMLLMLPLWAHSYPDCYDPFGNIVPVLTVSFSPTAAAAVKRPDGKIAIVINEDLLNKFSLPTQKVIFLHECGHVALAHLMKGPISIPHEQDADCFGIRAAITLGEIKHGDIEKVQTEFAALGAGDWNHLSGAKRAVNLMQCLSGWGSEDKWRSCKTKYYDNLKVIENSIPNLRAFKKACDAGSDDCKKAKALVSALEGGILKTITSLDVECPFVVDPVFSKIFSEFQKIKTALTGG